MKCLFGLVFVALSACSALPDKPLRAVQYDFGPSTTTAMANASLPTLALADVEAPGMSDGGTAILYRLGYADAQQLRPYTQARWSVPPAQLVGQRLRDVLGQRRAVLGASDSAALARTTGPAPRLLRLELQEFTQVFQSPVASTGLVRLRATLVESTLLGDSLLAQRSFNVQRPAPSADAPGGVRALAVATDALAQELDGWLEMAGR
ncbi:ABC-type transport auxiliary lipoprotein family protein [Rhodoferax sp.]|uniref:ABC-type transport auxiliary lipoprotein family protein n=1 Tax=Rhodoferax sp. TaxID=50421 RepID=UPI0025D05FBC|nr:ABC-type transport auxiliary lipoprotein family protein [Rhodoferax sp.]